MTLQAAIRKSVKKECSFGREVAGWGPGVAWCEIDVDEQPGGINLSASELVLTMVDHRGKKTVHQDEGAWALFGVDWVLATDWVLYE